MKLAKLLLLFITLIIFGKLYTENRPKKKRETVMNVEPSKPKVVVKKRDSINDLIDRIIMVESTGNDSAVNHRTNAVGCMQIRPIMVKDVNRIMGEECYTLSDRYSRSRSIEMFHVWRNHYHLKSSLEKIARCWNGGTRGHVIDATKRYWKKIKSVIL